MATKLKNIQRSILEIDAKMDKLRFKRGQLEQRLKSAEDQLKDKAEMKGSAVDSLSTAPVPRSATIRRSFLQVRFDEGWKLKPSSLKVETDLVRLKVGGTDFAMSTSGGKVNFIDARLLLNKVFGGKQTESWNLYRRWRDARNCDDHQAILTCPEQLFIGCVHILRTVSWYSSSLFLVYQKRVAKLIREGKLTVPSNEA